MKKTNSYAPKTPNSEKPSSVKYEPHAHLKHEEKILLDWCKEHLGRQITVLAESTMEGVMTADIACNGYYVEFKTTSGNLTTLDTLVRRAAKQAHGDCVIVNLRQVSYSLENAIQVVKRRMERSHLSHAYLLQDNILAAHLFLQKEGTK